MQMDGLKNQKDINHSPFIMKKEKIEQQSIISKGENSKNSFDEEELFVSVDKEKMNQRSDIRYQPLVLHQSEVNKSSIENHLFSQKEAINEEKIAQLTQHIESLMEGFHQFKVENTQHIESLMEGFHQFKEEIDALKNQVRRLEKKEIESNKQMKYLKNTIDGIQYRDVIRSAVLFFGTPFRIETWNDTEGIKNVINKSYRTNSKVYMIADRVIDLLSFCKTGLEKYNREAHASNLEVILTEIFHDEIVSQKIEDRAIKSLIGFLKNAEFKEFCLKNPFSKPMNDHATLRNFMHSAFIFT